MTLAGIVNDNKPESIKVAIAMVVNAEPGEKVTFVKLLQPAKARSPIAVTLAGMITDNKPVFLKVSSAMVVNAEPGEKVTSVKLEQS